MLTSLQMAWHMGHPLSQTLFTSLYIDIILNTEKHSVDNLSFQPTVEPKERSLTLQVLLAYCLAVMKTCSYVVNRVKSEHFYEVIEEY